MTISADKRRIQGEPDPEAIEQLRADRQALRELQLRIARNLAQVEQKAAFVYEGCASIMELGVRLGYDASEARRLCDLGRAMAVQVGLEDEVRQARVPLENAAQIGRVVGQAGLVRDGDQWIEYARLESPVALRRRVRRRLAEAALQEVGITEVSLFVTERTRDDFDRCRDIASRKARKSLTDDQAFGAVVEYYLDHEDPLRVKPGKRRMPDTSRPPRDPASDDVRDGVSLPGASPSSGASTNADDRSLRPPRPSPKGDHVREALIPFRPSRWDPQVAADRTSGVEGRGGPRRKVRRRGRGPPGG